MSLASTQARASPHIETDRNVSCPRQDTQKLLSGLCCLPLIPKGARPGLHFSLIAQMDAILYKEAKMRPERDVFAQSADDACTVFWGPPASGVPLGAVDGLFWGPVSVMAESVAAVASQHGRGLFIISLKDAAREDAPLIGQVFNAKVGSGTSRREPWLAFLRKHQRISFEFEGRPDLQGIYASFHHAVTPRAPPRKTSEFILQVVPNFGKARKLGAVADVLARATIPLPDTREQVDEGAHREPDFDLGEGEPAAELEANLVVCSGVHQVGDHLPGLDHSTLGH
jgi:hypothetical protein